MNLRGILTHFALLTLSLALLLPPFESALGQWSVPDELRAQVSVLNDEQIEFITSGAVLDFIPERQLEHELATRDADSLRGFVDDLMSLAAQMAYDPERDMGAAPLNLHSDGFNGHSVTTPAPLRDLKREPGPFSVHRYLYPQSGVPTFGGAKVAIWPEDLVAGNVDVAIIGVPSNMSSGRRDAKSGPFAMRAMNTIATPDMQSLVKPLEALSVVDYGNFAVDYMSTEMTVDHVTPDAERFGDHTVSDRQALFLLLDQGIVDGSETIQVGLRGPAVDVETLQWLRSQEVRYHTMAEIQQRGYENVLRRMLREVDRGPDTFFVSIDVSAIDPAEMIAAGRATSNGLRIDQVTRAIRQVCASKEIVGFEITDMAPLMDLSRLSVIHSNAVLNACLVGIAVRKSGLDPDYVHPLALDHGQR
jgi:agmatinase